MSIKYLNHFIFINFLGFIDHRRFQEQSLTVFETLTDNVPPEMVVFRQVFLAVNVMVQVCPFASDPVVLTAPVKQNPPIQKTFCHDYDDVAYNREAALLATCVGIPGKFSAGITHGLGQRVLGPLPHHHVVHRGPGSSIVKEMDGSTRVDKPQVFGV